MMKINCEIINDLLPLYCDDVCSEMSKKAVEDHIGECADCRKAFEMLKNDNNISSVGLKEEEESKIKFIKGVKNKLMIKKILISVVSVIVSVGVISGIYTVCTVLKSPVEYAEDKFTVSEYDNGTMVAIRYNGKSYAKLESAKDIIVNADGEEKNCLCIRYLESVSSKYFESGKNRRSIENGGDAGFSIEGVDCIYYLESGWTDDELANPGALADKMLEKGVLIWSK